MEEQSTQLRWAILTGEYPPDAGGVSDYTRLVAERLAAKGDLVEVWAPPQTTAQSITSSVKVHRLPDHFGVRSLSILSGVFRNLPPGTRVLVQYVPQAFGLKGMNLWLCLWLWMQRKRSSITVMFHEVATPWCMEFGWRTISYNFLAVVTRLMARLAARSAKRIYVATQAWEAMLQGYVPGLRIEWLPVPSNVPIEVEPADVASLRARLLRDCSCDFLIGHFGTFGGHIADGIRATLPEVLPKNMNAAAILIGRGSKQFADEMHERHPSMRQQLIATGPQPGNEIAKYIAACDLMVQPYIDGVSGRRGSAMAGLALGIPVVTTFGFLSEPTWKDSGAVKLANSFEEIPNELNALLHDSMERNRIGLAGKKLYQERFDTRHTINRLRDECISR